MFFKVSLAFLVCFILNESFEVNAHVQISDYRNHICNRNCDLKIKVPVCEYNFTIEWYSTLSKACYYCPNNLTDCFRPDCVAGNGVTRAIIAVNRMLPGPAIQVCKGDFVSIKIYNNLHLAESTSIHWHGIGQRGTPYMDGVGMVTQCPILPHTSFEYSFVANDPGTHFWHAHSGLQRQDGAFGPFIVRTNSAENIHYDKYDFDLSEHVIIVTEWLNSTAINKFVQHVHNNGNNKPESILINGRGVYFEYQTNLKNIIETPRAIFTVNKGYRYRFRLTNAGSLYCPIRFSIDNHNLTVIATDGNNVQPVEVEVITILAGERYDFVVNANQDIKNYWIRAKGVADCGVNMVYQTAVLNYETVPLYDIPSAAFNYSTMDRAGRQLNPWNVKIDEKINNTYMQVDELRSVDSDAKTKYDGVVNRKFYLSMEFNKIDNNEFQDPHLYPLSETVPGKTIFTPQINNISMMMPPAPPLYQWADIPGELICNLQNKKQVCPSTLGNYCSCIHVLEVDLNDLVEFIIVDEGFTYQSNHPMHLHGHEFAVLGIEKLGSSIKTSVIVEMDENNLLKRNFDRPPLKDTVTVPAGGYTIIRFIADNPGAWLFHCHLEFHSEIGMTLLVKVGKPSDLPKPPYNWQKCGSFQRNLEDSFNRSTKITFSLIILFGWLFVTIINNYKLISE